MARVRKSTLSFDAITLEGSLLPSAKFAAVAERKAEEQTDADYIIPKGLTLRDETARYFRIGQALFRDLHASSTPARHKTVEFTEQLLRVVFGFSDIQAVKTPKFRDDRLFPVTLEALGGRVPVVVVPPSDGLDHASNSLSQDRRRSAASALQDWLNVDEAAAWGLCTNGESLRLLRDNESLTRPAYLEADLRQIFEAEDFAGFSALWLVLHVSRFGRMGALPADCPLERWRESGSKEGLSARDRLRDGVEAALVALGTGFLTHPSNIALSTRLRDSTLPIDEYFRQLLRLIYRLIFLLAAEDRNLLHTPDATVGQRKLYADGYSLGALRDRAIRRSGWDNFHDRWSGLRVTFRCLANGEPHLGLPALGGIFGSAATPELDRVHISNRFLMEAIFRLAWLRDEGLLMPVNWRDMETEELGSVYESLLELTPRLSADGREFKFAGGTQTKGNARKTSGSYYTPDSLVQLLLDSALDPVLDRIESESEDPIKSLLGVSVIDPACGSGHFLLAAARRIAKRIIRHRCGDIHTEQDRLRALRDVVRSCIYGVDRNPMAVELAKVALWIETVEPGKPLGFLDASIRCGDSLLGLFTLDALRSGIPDAAYKPLSGDDKGTAKDFEKRNKGDKGERAGFLDFAGKGAQPLALPPLAKSLRSARNLPEDTLEQISVKRERFAAAHDDPRLVNLAQAADLYMAAFLVPKTASQSLDLHTSLVPTTADVWTALRAGTVYGPRLGFARHLAVEARVLHWPLEFPDVMNEAGFDVVLGNPPWERIKIQEQEFFASREPEIAEAPNAAARGRMIQQLKAAPDGSRERLLYNDFELAKRMADAASEFGRVDANKGGRFRLTGSGDLNTYALFTELFADLTSKQGRAGIIVPTGIATDASTAEFFGQMLTDNRLVSLHDFQTGQGFFDAIGHARFKFSLFTLRTDTLSAITPLFSFYSRTIEDFNRPGIKYAIPAETIAMMNPNTRTSPVFRAEKDAHIAKAIYQRIPVLVLEAGGGDGNPWQVSFLRMLDMAYDSGLFRTARQLQQLGYDQDGLNRSLPHQTPEGHHSAAEMNSGDLPSLYLPLYEGKMIHQYDHRSGTFSGLSERPQRGAPIPELTQEDKANADCEAEPWYWVPSGLVDKILDKWKWKADWSIGYRFSTHSVNERTLIVSVVPHSATPHMFPQIITGADISPQRTCALLACLNSLVVDYICRLKMSRQGLDSFIVKQLPVIPPDFYGEAELSFIIPRVLELTYTSYSLRGFAQDLQYDGSPFSWDEERRALLQAELDVWFAHAYGLKKDDVCYILDPVDVMGPDYPSETFRRLKENEIRLCGEYRTRRLVLDAWDRMERGELSCPQPYLVPPQSASRSMTIVQRNISDQNPLLGAGPLFEGIESTSVEHPRFADPSTLPNNVWAMPNYNSISVQLQLAAILKQLPGPTSAARVRLAALYALHPDYLTPRLSGTELKTWQRLTGDRARISAAANVIQFVPRLNTEWRDAYTQLRGMRALLEDATNDTWAPGSVVQGFLTEGWADGRAGFVMKAMESMEIETSIAELPVDLQTWVRAHAA